MGMGGDNDFALLVIIQPLRHKACVELRRDGTKDVREPQSNEEYEF